MRKKTVWPCLLAAAVVMLSTSLATAAPTIGERALSTSELSNTFGACCNDDYIDSQTCSTTNGQDCVSYLPAPTLCGVAFEYSGNVIQQCIEGNGGTCLVVKEVDCFRMVGCNQSIPLFYECKESVEEYTIDLITTCVECTTGTPCAWIQVNTHICEK